MPALSLIIRELEIFFEFSWRDWSTTLIPGSIFAVGAMRGLPFRTIVTNYSLLLLWLTFYIYTFDLTNQIKGVVEDKIDKPDRPIPSGKVSLKGAKLRCIAAFTAFIGISIYEPNVLLETLVWILVTGVLYTAGNHWFIKNTVAMTIATWSLLSASWKIIAPHTPKSEVWVYSLATWAGVSVHIQDLRDIRGDAIIGRKTMPIVFGNRTTRIIISFVFIPAALFVLHLGHIFELAPRTLTILHIIIAYRVLQLRDARYDHKTYMYYTYSFCVALALTSIDGVDLRTVLQNDRIGSISSIV